MPHLASEKYLLKPGHKKATDPTSVESAPTETGGRLREHTMEDVEMSLRVLAYNGSNYSRSSIQLKDDYNITVHTQTLRSWANNSFPRRYAEIQKDQDKEISDKLSGQLTDVAMKSTELQGDLLDDLAAKRDDLQPKDIAPAIRNLAQSTTPAIEKAQLLRGKVTSRTEVKDADQLIAKLAALGIIKNADALDIEDAEVVELEDQD